jgi:protoporphyrinogen oxidase
MKCEYLILGGGVTGLSFANFVKDEDWILLEGMDEVGGYCKTIQKDGFVWDYSGHFFHFNTEFIKKFFLSKMEDTKIKKVKKKSSIYYNGRVIDFPFQKNIHQLERAEFIDCLYDLVNRNSIKPSNFLEVLYSNFGLSITEKFLKPYNEKLYNCDLSHLDADAMGRFFPYADTKEIICNFKKQQDTSYNTSFLYPEKGCYEFIKALLKNIDNKKILLNSRAERINPNSKTVYLKDGREIKYNHLISSIPFDKLLVVSGTTHEASIYTSNKVAVFNLGFDLPSTVKESWVYFPQRDISFYRVGFYNNILDSKRMSLYVELGKETGEEVSKSKSLKTVLKDLNKVGIVKNHKLLASHFVVMNPAYVHITSASIGDFKTQIKKLNLKDIYSIGRYGGWKYCSIEDNVLEALELSEKLKNL